MCCESKLCMANSFKAHSCPLTSQSVCAHTHTAEAAPYYRGVSFSMLTVGSTSILTAGSSSFAILTGDSSSFSILTVGRSSFSILTGDSSSFSILTVGSTSILTAGSSSFAILTGGSSSFSILTVGRSSFSILTVGSPSHINAYALTTHQKQPPSPKQTFLNTPNWRPFTH